LLIPILLGGKASEPPTSARPCPAQRDKLVIGPGPEAGGSNQGKPGCVYARVKFGIDAALCVLPAGVAEGVCPKAGIAAAIEPWAAAVVKRFGEMSLAGITFPNPSNQCQPSPMPFIYKLGTIRMLQQPDRITIVYSGYNTEVRRVRLNEPHPSPLTPSWYGDSVGHYEGDTLVIDTVGVKTDRKYAMIDLFGTPYTDKLHIVERYRLRDYADVEDALERNTKENWLVGGDVWTQHRNGKFLQLHVTIEDEGVFTTPWTATLTYAPGPERLSEGVCAENRHEYYNNKESDVPTAEKPDF